MKFRFECGHADHPEDERVLEGDPSFVLGYTEDGHQTWEIDLSAMWCVPDDMLYPPVEHVDQYRVLVQAADSDDWAELVT